MKLITTLYLLTQMTDIALNCSNVYDTIIFFLIYETIKKVFRIFYAIFIMRNIIKTIFTFMIFQNYNYLN